MIVNSKQLLAYILIALGLIAIIQRFTGNVGWLIVAIVAAIFLFTYVSRRHYGLLVTGSILSGLAIGILLEGNWGWNGSFLISLGAGFFAIDQVERRENRWPIYAAGILAGLGLMVGILESGLLTSLWFAVVLIALGLFLVFWGDKPLGEGNWVQVNPVPAKSSPESSESGEPGDAIKVSPKSESQPVNGTEEASKASALKVKSQQRPEEVVLERPNEALQERLERWRRETAKAENRASYLVLNNESLMLIAEQKPQTLAELQMIKGIGKVKLERYGEAILTLVQTA